MVLSTRLLKDLTLDLLGQINSDIHKAKVPEDPRYVKFWWLEDLTSDDPDGVDKTRYSSFLSLFRHLKGW